MELGTYRLAEINKGGGLRQKAVGLATQYLNGIGQWVDMPTSMTPTAHTHSEYAASTHNHSIPDLYCGVPNIVPGRILISGSGGSSNPTWLDAGTNGKILGWTSGAPAWVDAPSGSSVTAANPIASVGLTAVNGSATTFMRSDAAPKLDVSIAPTWTGTHTFNGYCEFNGGTNLSTTGRVRNFLQLSIGTTLTPAAGTDLFILFDTSSTTTQTLIIPTTNMASRAGDIIRVNYSGSGHIAFSTGSGNDLIKPAYSGADETDYLTSEYTNVDCVLVCDGTYWRYYVLFCAYN